MTTGVTHLTLRLGYNNEFTILTYFLRIRLGRAQSYRRTTLQSTISLDISNSKLLYYTPVHGILSFKSSILVSLIIMTKNRTSNMQLESNREQGVEGTRDKTVALSQQSELKYKSTLSESEMKSYLTELL